MVKIYVVDNGGQWTHREWRTLKYLKVDTKIVPNTAPYKEVINEDINGVVLSGGSPRVGLKDKLGNCSDYLKNADFPILGICAGHQFMARYFGGKVQQSEIPEFGKLELKLNKDDDLLFKGVPQKSIVWESHHRQWHQRTRSLYLWAGARSVSNSLRIGRDHRFVFCVFLEF